MKEDSLQYTLYIDESGDFMSSSADPAEQSSARSQKGTSQLVGVLVPQGKALTKDKANAILSKAHASAGLNYQDKFHGNEIESDLILQKITSSILDSLKAGGIQPVRLVNKEEVSYGARVEIYVNLVAELLMRVYRLIEIKHPGRCIAIELHAAAVKLGKNQDGSPRLLDKDEYGKRVREYLTRIGIQRNLGKTISNWKFTGVQMRSGARDPEMHICDCLSHASYREFKRCDEALKSKYAEQLGKYDFTLILREFADRVEELCIEESYGLAIRELALEGVAQGKNNESIKASCGKVVEELAGLATPWRNQQLLQVTGWLEECIEQKREIGEGKALCEWLREQIVIPLAKRLSDNSHETDWFAYAVERWLLTACNHLADLDKATESNARMENLVDCLAGRWEYAALLMGGMTVQAVHLTDRFEYEDAIVKAGYVDAFYLNLSYLFIDAYPMFPPRVRSEGRGKALGTRMQAYMHAGLSDPSRFQKARELSDAAIDEFAGLADKQRQYQYRCQLEAYAGQYGEARKFLTLSLGLGETASHDLIVEKATRGFALLHWIRLGVAESRKSPSPETTEFSRAWAKIEQATFADIINSNHYPAHGILRQMAIWRVIANKDVEGATKCLHRLREIRNDSYLFSLIYFAAVMETASAVWRQGYLDRARELLDNPRKKNPGLKQDLEKFVDLESVARYPKIKEAATSWLGMIDGKLEGSAEPFAALERAASCIGY